MTDVEMQIAIAEANDWHGVKGRPHPLDETVKVLSGYLGVSKYPAALPNYPKDLNAMNEAEKVLDTQAIDVRSLYLDYLYCIVGWGLAENPADAKFEGQYLSVRATARQRAEAFLRTLGKWED